MRRPGEGGIFGIDPGRAARPCFAIGGGSMGTQPPGPESGVMAMTIAAILGGKGHEVVSIDGADGGRCGRAACREADRRRARDVRWRGGRHFFRTGRDLLP